MRKKIPTPLETADLGADVVSQIVAIPARVGSNVLGAAARALGNIDRDIAKPREHAEIPPPPGVIVEAGVSGLGHIATGILDVFKGALDGVIQTGNGIRREVDTFIRR